MEGSLDKNDPIPPTTSHTDSPGIRNAGHLLLPSVLVVLQYSQHLPSPNIYPRRALVLSRTTSLPPSTLTAVSTMGVGLMRRAKPRSCLLETQEEIRSVASFQADSIPSSVSERGSLINYRDRLRALADPLRRPSFVLQQ
jgi:hypothetical protein